MNKKMTMMEFFSDMYDSQIKRKDENIEIQGRYFSFIMGDINDSESLILMSDITQKFRQ